MIALFLLLTCSTRVEQRNPCKRIDDHALRAPERIERSPENLVKYLTQPAVNDYEKTRAIYRWITHNIHYDMTHHDCADCDPSPSESILKRRTAMCGGYSGLLETLARIAELEVVRIEGYAKGSRYAIGDAFDGPPNHAWNAVRIEDRWFLMDATWGAGYVNERDEYIHEYDEYYFFPPAEELIYSHFPLDPKWQLMKNPVSRVQFEGYPLVKSAFFKNGMKLVSHHQGTIHAVHTLDLHLAAPKSLVLEHVLRGEGEPLDTHFLRETRMLDDCTIRIVLPQPGRYTLSIFAKGVQDTGNARLALRYRIEAE
jgi:transglutaminase/protease-like cytokinesis protein 3